jgi:hypothetical protein
MAKRFKNFGTVSLIDKRNRQVYLNQGNRVEFEPSETEKGVCAPWVKKIEL